MGDEKFAFPDFRKCYETEFHNSVESEQLDLRCLYSQSQHPLSTYFTLVCSIMYMVWEPEENVEGASLLLRYILFI